MNKFLVFLVISLIVLVAFLGLFGLYEVQFFTNRASIKTINFSVDNSYVFITPLRARADGQEKIRITVFVLDDRGLGVEGKMIVLEQNEALNIEKVQETTDSFGKSYFDVMSNKAGDYYLKVLIDNTELKQKAHLSFY